MQRPKAQKIREAASAVSIIVPNAETTDAAVREELPGQNSPFPPDPLRSRKRQRTDLFTERSSFKTDLTAKRSVAI